MTNGDKLRSRSNLEIADILADLEHHLQKCDFCVYRSNSDCSHVDETCKEAIFMWLSEEYHENNER